MPTISPARTSKEISFSTFSRLRLRTDSTTSPIGRVSAMVSRTSRPTIMRMTLSWSSSQIGRVPTSSPSRNTVTRSATRKPLPASARRRRCRGPWSSGLSPQQRGGRSRRRKRCRRLVHDEHLGILGNRAGDLDELLVGRRQASGRGGRVEMRRDAGERIERARCFCRQTETSP